MPAETGAPYHKRSYTALVEDMLNVLGSGQGGNRALTDATEGSVVRTLVEVFARELAVAYEQLDRVYRFGFLDTAEGVALDNLVALVGIHRREAGHLEGEVIFSRSTPAPANIAIPAGTLVAGRETPLFETLAEKVLGAGGTRVGVPVRSVEPAAEKVPKHRLSVMPRPIAGIETFTNANEILPRGQRETDRELRERARAVVRGGQRGTLAAIREAAAALGIESIELNESGDGRVAVILGDDDLDDETLERVRKKVEGVRPAGIPVEVQPAKRIRIGLSATLVLDKDRYRDAEKAAIEHRARRAVTDYFADLGPGDRVRWTKLSGILTANDEIVEVEHTAGRPFLAPMSMEGEDLAGSRTKGENAKIEIVPEADERALLDTDRLELALEPPWTEARVDLFLELLEGADPGAVTERTRSSLRDFFMKSAGILLSLDVVGKLLDADRPSVSRMELTVKRERDGSVVVLDGGEEDTNVQLGPRELARMGALVVDGG